MNASDRVILEPYKYSCYVCKRYLYIPTYIKNRLNDDNPTVDIENTGYNHLCEMCETNLKETMDRVYQGKPGIPLGKEFDKEAKEAILDWVRKMYLESKDED